MIVFLLTLIDIHTLFVLVFHSHLSTIYVFSGSSFAILKGLVFYLPNRDLFSLLDIIMGFVMLFLLLGEVYTAIWITIFLYLTYKIVMSMAAFF